MPQSVKTRTSLKGTGLRVVQAVQVVELLVVLINAACMSPSYFAYDISLIVALVIVATSVLSIWLIDKRARAAKPFIIVASLISAAGVFIDYFFLGGWRDVGLNSGLSATTVAVILQIAGWAGIALYMGFSSKVCEVLTMRLSDIHKGDTPHADRAPYPTQHVAPIDLPFTRRICTWPFWRNLIFYFVAFSFLGHWAEILFCQLIVAGVFMGEYDPTNAMLWNQWLYPFSAEGTAVSLIVLLLYPLKEWLMNKTGRKVCLVLPLSFLANGFVCTLIDFTTGITCNQDYSLWDYRAMPFNFMGQVCLQNSLVYTIVATLVVWVVYPIMDRAIAKLPDWLANALFLVFLSIYLFSASLHFLALS